MAIRRVLVLNKLDYNFIIILLKKTTPHIPNKYTVERFV